MSKISKFINKPSLFIKDMIVNKSPILQEVDKAINERKNLQSKLAEKTNIKSNQEKIISFKLF